MNRLSPPVRRLVAVVLLLLLLLAAWTAVRASLAWMHAAFEGVHDARFALQQWRSRVDSSAPLPDAAARSQQQTELAARLAWVGPPDAAEARLQGQLAGALREHGLVAEQLRSLPAQTKGPLLHAVFELRGSGPEASFYGLLKTVEGAAPAFVVDRAVVRSADAGAAPAGQGAPLQFELRLVAVGVAAMPALVP